MSDKESRKVGDYNVLQSMKIGYKEILLCENPTGPKDERYLCCYAEQVLMYEKYDDAIAGDDFAEIVKLYGGRVAQAAGEFLKEGDERIAAIGGPDDEITKSSCQTISPEESLVGQVVVVRGSVLRPEFQHGTRQLMLCTGGNGAQPMARGRSCNCVYLYDGRETVFYRSDFLGVLKPENMPEWAKDRLDIVKAARQDGQPEKEKPSVRDRLKEAGAAATQAPTSHSTKKEAPSL